MTVATPPSFRQRRRAELVEQVLLVARKHMGESGAAQLSLRAVAREIGIAPSALYRYFPSRDELLTALIARAFVEIDGVIRSAVEAALTDQPATAVSAWVEATTTYRSWVLEHREEFSLVYGTPIPGYAAPEEMTGHVGREAGAGLFRIIEVALDRGDVDLTSLSSYGAAMPAEMREAMSSRARERGFELCEQAAAGLIQFSYGAWAKLQGLIMMEVFGHLRPVQPHAREFFRAQSAAIVSILGPATTTTSTGTG